MTELPRFYAVDLANKPSVSLTSYLYRCGDCRREHLSPSPSIPDGWDLISHPDGTGQYARCPDCNQVIEEQKTHELRGKSGSIMIDETAFATNEPPFHFFLEKQEDGRFLINLKPGTVLMRLHPLAFLLSADQAEALAADLRDQVRNLRVFRLLPTDLGERA